MKGKVSLFCIILLPLFLNFVVSDRKYSKLDSLTLFDEKNVEELCQEKDKELLNWFIKKYSCLPNWIKFYNKTSEMEVLESCWSNHTQMAHPRKEDEWFNLFCLTNSPGILINTAYHCFLRNITHNGKVIHRKVLAKYRRCTKVRVRTENDRRSSHEDSPNDEDEDGSNHSDENAIPSCVKKEEKNSDDYEDADALRYCESKKAKEKRKNLLCHPNSTSSQELREEEVLQMKCLQMSSPKHLPLIKECWKFITQSEYPETYDSWLNFTCSSDYPYALKKMVKWCVGDHLATRHHALDELFDACHGEYFPTVDRVHSQLMYREYRANVTKLKYNKLCIEKDPVVLQIQLKQNRLRCATNVILNRMPQKAGINYCYESYSNVSVPSSDEDWRNVTCTYQNDRAMDSMKIEIEFCLSQIYFVDASVSRRYNEFEDKFLRCIMGRAYYLKDHKKYSLQVKP